MQINWNPEKRKVADLKHWEKNPRKISEQKFAELKEKIQKRGFHDVIKIDTDNIILSGNMRKDALEQLGISEVNVLVPDRKLTIEEMVLVGLESNVLSGEWDDEALKGFKAENLFESGLDDSKISSLFDNMQTENDNFNEKKAVEEATKKTNVKIGDIYQLGEHRLMCGDSTDIEHVVKLMGGGIAKMAYCDPPYNINLSYSGGIGTKNKYQGNYEDNKKDSVYMDFVNKTMKSAIAVGDKNLHIFYWCDEKYIWMMQKLISDNGGNNRRVCFWIKNNQNPTPAIAFNKACEPCVYGTIGRPYLNPNYKALNEILNKEVTTGNQQIEDILDLINIWMVKRDNAVDYDHPTQKPVILHEKAIKRCTRPGEIVIDLFGGSGSTMIACEQLKRKSCLMEISPVFAQVIINRYEAYTGNKAIKI